MNGIGNDFRVLVVDDYEDGMETMGALLSELGYNVKTCPRSCECVELVRDFSPHAILLDLAMPEIDGFEVARRLREADDLGPFILVAHTGLGDLRTRERCKREGFDAFLLKPALAGEVEIVLEEAARALPLEEFPHPPPGAPDRGISTYRRS